MANNGIDDILITNQIVDPEKIERLVRLRRHADVKVLVDDLRVARAIAKEALKRSVEQSVLIEVDIHMKRCGVLPGQPAVELARKVARLKGLSLKGVLGYEGPFFELPNFDERRTAASSALFSLRDTVEMIEQEGIPVDVVSAGSTGTYNIAGEYPKITEVEAGSYVFMDSTYGKLQGLDFRCALTVLATVISRPVRERVVVDAGLKAITQEFGMPSVKGSEGAKLYHLSEEHGPIEVKRKARMNAGDKIELVPSHCCTTVNLHDRYYGIRDDSVEVIYPISARGRLQ
jgi:D-serine deaminase-like pyridoxal phosphate-dependent protein